MFQASEIDPDLRKCIISKHTVIYYELRNEGIHILDVVDSRQDPDEVQSEIDRLFG
jgi:plasmid stabilization system protein ParE